MAEDDSQPRLLPEIAQPQSDVGSGRGLSLPVSGETEPLVLSRGNAFCVVNARGDIAPAGARDLGLFHDDTRHLSYYHLFIAGGPPQVLSADTHGASSSQIDLTLTDSQFGGFLSDPQNFLHLRRKQVLDGAELVEQLVLTNHLRRGVNLWLELRMAADFADIFDVRGMRRKRRGAPRPTQFAGDQLIFGHKGLDGIAYRTVAHFLPVPRRLGQTGPFWELALGPGETTVLEVRVLAERGSEGERTYVPFHALLERVRAQHRAFREASTAIRCNNVLFDTALHGDMEDLDALRLDVDGRRIVGAGIPWFAAPFGRDSLITSFAMLSVHPQLALETLETLARYQGTRFDDWTEEEPGRIMHELRRGELARAGEVPHAPYYGTIDATPLWLILFGEVIRWLGDRALAERLLPNAERALAWIERRLDEGGGFLRYQRKHDKGLENQGWKDSRDGVSHPDGTIAEAPIALVEVQGYAVAALRAMARVVELLGDGERARTLRARAEALTAALHEAFWLPQTGYYALALDGAGRQVSTITSNPGHLLFCHAVPREHAARVVDVLLSDELFSGFGVRTLARGQAVYNPLSYHNGSVWPHDNALCAVGAAWHGRMDAAQRIVDGMYFASLHFRRQRLPELFCGLARAEGDFLVHYPVACSPQAWASASFFLLLQAVLGLHPDAPLGRLTIVNPALPSFADRLDLCGLRVGKSRASIRFARHDSRTHVDVLEVAGAPLEVRIVLG